MSAKQDIRHRVGKLIEQKPLTALERSRKLKSLQVTSGKLISYIGTMEKEADRIDHDLKEARNQQAVISLQLQQLEANDEPIVTEHALLRYLERKVGIDLDLCHQEILNLSDKEKVKAGNTIVTVFTDPDDHFNLAERESE